MGEREFDFMESGVEGHARKAWVAGVTTGVLDCPFRALRGKDRARLLTAIWSGTLSLRPLVTDGLRHAAEGPLAGIKPGLSAKFIPTPERNEMERG